MSNKGQLPLLPTWLPPNGVHFYNLHFGSNFCIFGQWYMCCPFSLLHPYDCKWQSVLTRSLYYLCSFPIRYLMKW
jgi:hypothetical protein